MRPITVPGLIALLLGLPNLPEAQPATLAATSSVAARGDFAGPGLEIGVCPLGRKGVRHQSLRPARIALTHSGQTPLPLQSRS
jgi:hypothetical protein